MDSIQHSPNESTTFITSCNVDAKRITLFIKLIAAQNPSKTEAFSHSHPVSHTKPPQPRNRYFKRKACSFIKPPMAAIALVGLVIVCKHQINISPTGNDLFETTGYVRGHGTELSYIVKYRAGKIPFLASVLVEVHLICQLQSRHSMHSYRLIIPAT